MTMLVRSTASNPISQLVFLCTGVTKKSHLKGPLLANWSLLDKLLEWQVRLRIVRQLRTV